MSENEFLEMASQFKEVYESKEREIKRYKRELKEQKKIIVTCYGYIRMLDNLLDNQIFIQEPFEMLRSYLSIYMDKEIFKDEEEEDS